MIPGLLLIFLHGCEIKSGSGLRTRLSNRALGIYALRHMLNCLTYECNVLTCKCDVLESDPRYIIKETMHRRGKEEEGKGEEDEVQGGV